MFLNIFIVMSHFITTSQYVDDADVFPSNTTFPPVFQTGFQSRDSNLHESELNQRPDCGLFASRPESARIYRGYQPWGGQFPWAVSIRVLQLEPFRTVHVCTGSLIESTWVMTAAHCFWDQKDASRFYLLFNELNIRRATRILPFILKKTPGDDQNVFIHPFYKDGGSKLSKMLWDVSLIRLSRVAPGYKDKYDGHPDTVNTVCYMSSLKFNYGCGEALVLAGYGMLDYNEANDRTQMIPMPDNPGFLHFIFTTLKFREGKEEAVQRLYSTLSYKDPKQPEVKDRRHGCKGDSGSPQTWYQLSGLSLEERTEIVDGNTLVINEHRAIQVGILISVEHSGGHQHNIRSTYVKLPPNLVGEDPFITKTISKIRSNLPDDLSFPDFKTLEHHPQETKPSSCIIA